MMNNDEQCVNFDFEAPCLAFFGFDHSAPIASLSVRPIDAFVHAPFCKAQTTSDTFLEFFKLNDEQKTS